MRSVFTSRLCTFLSHGRGRGRETFRVGTVIWSQSPLLIGVDGTLRPLAYDRTESNLYLYYLYQEVFTQLFAACLPTYVFCHRALIYSYYNLYSTLGRFSTQHVWEPARDYFDSLSPWRLSRWRARRPEPTSSCCGVSCCGLFQRVSLGPNPLLLTGDARSAWRHLFIFFSTVITEA